MNREFYGSLEEVYRLLRDGLRTLTITRVRMTTVIRPDRYITTISFIRLLLFFFVLVLRCERFTRVNGRALVLEHDLVFLIRGVVNGLNDRHRHTRGRERNFLGVNTLLMVIPTRRFSINRISLFQVMN